MRAVPSAVLVLVVGCAAGCTVTASGTPAPLDSSSAVAQAKALVANRPKEIRLDGVGAEQVCALLTEPQRRNLGIEWVQADPSDGRGRDKFRNKGCSFESGTAPPRYGYAISPVTQEGADVWLRPGATNVEAQLVTVAGYPAVRNRLRGDERACFVDVSVADGQRLGIQYSFDSSPVTETEEQVCRKALDAAELITRNLVRQQG
ncbi:hypothetical protein JOF53_006925 [Crossiella equi]|uniref:DUF3558 domain-containing protein n=1 Tax=Crossiella equi TaxID=130796 RepID=A0ABS5ANB3_9PSEU|nr:DUF3558 domain-containing protein [Crossiella equi]MBP2478053.1 hypothetical protein [Crossiella equi]